jgi:hypothetical protein
MLQFNPFIGPASLMIREFMKQVCERHRTGGASSLVGPSKNKPETPMENSRNSTAAVAELYADAESLETVGVSTLLSMHRLCVLFNSKWMSLLSKKVLVHTAPHRHTPEPLPCCWAHLLHSTSDT